ncbi:MAG TPA: O-antigen ligase family protein, partial [Chloroflexota bacterium]
TPRRSDLWTAALRMLAQHPLLGVGPDNFRHVYGTYLGLSTWDERVHANNFYLEMLADVGLPATAAFGGLLAIVGVCLVRCLRAEPRAAPVRLWAVGLAAAMAAFLIHGLLDYFLEFTPTYLLFWLVAGLAIALERRVLDPKLYPAPVAP